VIATKPASNPLPDIEASGFEIAKHEYDPHPLLTIAELPPASSKEVISLFNQNEEHEKPANDEADALALVSGLRGLRGQLRNELPLLALRVHGQPAAQQSGEDDGGT